MGLTSCYLDVLGTSRAQHVIQGIMTAKQVLQNRNFGYSNNRNYSFQAVNNKRRKSDYVVVLIYIYKKKKKKKKQVSS